MTWHFHGLNSISHSCSQTCKLFMPFAAMPFGDGSTVPREGFDSSVIMPFS